MSKVQRGAYKMKGLGRFASITRILVKHGLANFAEWLVRPGKSRANRIDDELVFRSGFISPKKLRLVLEELGPSFIKLGQLMSTRADIFPSDFIEELKKLQDRVPPVPFTHIQAVIEQQTGRPLNETYRQFNQESIAAASVAQVHTAELFTGEKVAVKTIRPGIKDVIQKDIGLMYYFAGMIQRRSKWGRIVRPVNIIREFERVIFRELDMFIEAGSMEKFTANFKDSEELHIPKVYWEYTTRSVLVMEHIQGVKMDQVDKIRELGIDPKEIAMIGLRSFSRQLMEFGFFHADPHPANAIVMDDGRVGLVDFGITGYLDDEMMLQIANLFLGYAEHDYERVLDALHHAGLIDEAMRDLPAFRADLKDMSETFYGRSLKKISVRDVYDQVMTLVLKYHILLPRNFLLLLKTFVQTEALGKLLDSDAGLLEVTRPYAKKLIQSGYEADKIFAGMRKETRIIGHHMKKIPGLVHTILDQTARGNQGLEIRHSGFKDLDDQIEKAVNRLTVGMIICASIIAGSLILNSGAEIMEFSFDFFGRRTLSLTAVLGVTGYLIASVLGGWLIFSILRSKKL